MLAGSFRMKHRHSSVKEILISDGKANTFTEKSIKGRT